MRVMDGQDGHLPGRSVRDVESVVGQTQRVSGSYDAGDALEVAMRVLRWAVALTVVAVAAGFAAGLLFPRKPADLHPTYDAPTADD